MESYQIFEDRNEILIEPTKDIDDDVLTTYMRMVVLIKNDHKRKINNTKDEDLYVYWRFIFELAARAERLFSHCKYTKTETRNRLAPQIFEATSFLKFNRELWEYS